ncbi:hypothetical protein [Chromobacterium violaceum]|uniref:hypothetical protein n=1 Tax=Chromobacterium violaceum TaxID=536 RepID=UPI0015FCA453|nr:hypothetical protein [Chromobacterium violaceum]MBA8735343.1 hypothetical protein [Chromobacterium violaceum]
MNWFKKEDPKIIGYGLALSLVPASVTWAMGAFSLAHVSTTNAYWMIVWYISVYILMFFCILSMASTNEKTRQRLLAAGLGMILLGIFAANNCAELVLKIEGLDIVNKAYTVVIGNLLQNICLYLSAAVGGGIVASSIFEPDKIIKSARTPAQNASQPVPIQSNPANKRAEHKRSNTKRK